ncbi:hypothetical protein PRK78_003977 [Emydomyces testavorans]|uniref:Uncharacterized protein n=1 Tax=Emydomyces testavorans TaxID=2070801 RepID=A0AAF0DH09_9EURO|nr:hypothetical protein PRK78_003977 [Emydomyces testavorans]
MPPNSHSGSKSASKIPTLTSTESSSMSNKDGASSPEKPEDRVSPPMNISAPGKWDDLAQSLRNCNWQQLQERFIEAMEERMYFGISVDIEARCLSHGRKLLSSVMRTELTKGLIYTGYIESKKLTLDKDSKREWTTCRIQRSDWKIRSSIVRDRVALPGIFSFSNTDNRLTDASVVKAFENALALLRDD